MSQRKNTYELETEYWMRNAQNYLLDIINDSKVMTMSSNTPAKNIILFLGDGMSLTTVAAARMYFGAEETSLSFEKFRHFGLSKVKTYLYVQIRYKIYFFLFNLKTYCVDKQVADSACSSTAYLSGVKANYGTMGLSAKIPLNSCDGQNNKDEHTVTIAQWAQNQCKSTGLVTTSKVTDASPGGLYARELEQRRNFQVEYILQFRITDIANRYWENDYEVKNAGCDPTKTVDIARQFLENDVAKQFKIVLACGRNEFRDKSMFDEESILGKRSDKRDLIKEWVNNRSEQGKSTYVYDKKGLLSISNETEYVLGLFGADHCAYNIDVEQNNWNDEKPILSEMTVAAIKHLQKNNDFGYFLFVEGARIDMAHHENWARIALDETREFSRAIEKARNMTDENDTLIVVTADHSHTMTYNGYSASRSFLSVLQLNLKLNF